MSPFEYRDGAYRALWDAFEITVFAAMARAVIDTIQSGSKQSASKQNGSKADPALAKLFPPASHDAVAAKEFSRLVGHQIADAKLNSLMQFGLTIVSNLPDAGDAGIDLDDAGDNSIEPNQIEVCIPDAEAQSALQALTAIRVFLGAKLQIENDQDSEILFNLLQTAAQTGNPSPDNASLEQQLFLANVFFASGFVQETLVEAMAARL